MFKIRLITLINNKYIGCSLYITNYKPLLIFHYKNDLAEIFMYISTEYNNRKFKSGPYCIKSVYFVHIIPCSPVVQPVFYEHIPLQHSFFTSYH